MTGSVVEGHARPWAALWALCLGFFMILVDTTIVSVATPALIEGLHADVNAVVWVTSAYLLAYAVPLLITGRLGDRFGPKNIYLVGLVIFTASSGWCALTGSISELITARVVQGLGAALMTPQTMAVITRIFPSTGRGRAMGAWGAVAGVAVLVGPIVGGVLIDSLGWEWIFLINVPVGVVAFVLAVALVPDLPTRSHRFDILGVLLSAIGMFLLVFGIQEGQTYHWSTITGPISVWLLIGLGIAVLAAFVYWQHRTVTGPLLPLTLFRDRNFSLANLAITAVGFSITAMTFPVMLYAQNVLGLSPTRAALLMAPSAIIGAILPPWVGRLVDRVQPRVIASIGLLALPVSLAWFGEVMRPGQPIWVLLLPLSLLGVANGFLWSPLSTTAIRNLPLAHAGAGAGVYNTTRQVGAVLGSAAIAVLMESRLAAAGLANLDSVGTRVPAAFREGYATAMGESVWLAAGVSVIALVAALFFATPESMRRVRRHGEPAVSHSGVTVG